MIRLPDWEQRLSRYLADVLERPHRYGEHDCALHGANAVLALTGIDYGAAFRGRYFTRAGARRALRLYGAGSIEAEFDRHLQPIAPALAGRGDLVLVEGAIGVCLAGYAVLVGDEGLIRKPRPTWSRAWKV